MNSIAKTQISVKPIRNAMVDDCLTESVILALKTNTIVVLTYETKNYTINPVIVGNAITESDVTNED